jgi:hypothetical protein
LVRASLIGRCHRRDFRKEGKVALKVTLNNPAYGKDEVAAVQGLGLLKNGKAVTLTEAQEQEYFSLHGKTVKEGLKDDENFSVDGTAEFKSPGELPEVSDTFAGEDQKEVSK